jgi:hypothetical protein
LLGCISSGHANLLTSPVTFTEDNMTPASVSFVVTNIGLTVGNILMAVFGSMFIVLATYNATSALVEDFGPVGKVSLRAFTMALAGFGCAICYATASKCFSRLSYSCVTVLLLLLVVGFTRYGSSHHEYSGNDWAQIFGTSTVPFFVSPLLISFSFLSHSRSMDSYHDLVFWYGMCFRRIKSCISSIFLCFLFNV